jgi:hypothetical protein
VVERLLSMCETLDSVLETHTQVSYQGKVQNLMVPLLKNQIFK